MTADRDMAPLSSVLCGLQADYPEWCFALRRCCDGLRLEAYRPHSSGGLYAMITADPAELRRELDSVPRPSRPADGISEGLTVVARCPGQAE